MDVFASAGGKEMDQLQTKHFIDESNQVNFASNALVLKHWYKVSRNHLTCVAKRKYPTSLIEIVLRLGGN